MGYWGSALTVGSTVKCHQVTLTSSSTVFNLIEDNPIDTPKWKKNAYGKVLPWNMTKIEKTAEIFFLLGFYTHPNNLMKEISTQITLDLFACLLLLELLTCMIKQSDLKLNRNIWCLTAVPWAKRQNFRVWNSPLVKNVSTKIEGLQVQKKMGKWIINQESESIR